MNLYQSLTISGLILDIIGVWMLFRFGLPNRYPEKGVRIVWRGEGDDEAVSQEQRRYRMCSYSGLLSLGIGFGLQIAGTLFN